MLLGVCGNLGWEWINCVELKCWELEAVGETRSVLVLSVGTSARPANLGTGSLCLGNIVILVQPQNLYGQDLFLPFWYTCK